MHFLRGPQADEIKNDTTSHADFLNPEPPQRHLSAIYHIEEP